MPASKPYHVILHLVFEANDAWIPDVIIGKLGTDILAILEQVDITVKSVRRGVLSAYVMAILENANLSAILVS